MHYFTQTFETQAKGSVIFSKDWHQLQQNFETLSNSLWQRSLHVISWQLKVQNIVRTPSSKKSVQYSNIYDKQSLVWIKSEIFPNKVIFTVVY